MDNKKSLRSILIPISFLMDFTLITWKGNPRSIYFILLFIATIIKDIEIYKIKKKEKNT